MYFIPVQVGGFTIMTFTKHLRVRLSKGLVGRLMVFTLAIALMNQGFLWTGRPFNLQNYTIKAHCFNVIFKISGLFKGLFRPSNRPPSIPTPLPPKIAALAGSVLRHRGIVDEKRIRKVGSRG